jgi:hypothetical protein
LQFNKVVLKACASDPHERYQSAEELRKALSQAQGWANRRGAEILPPFNLCWPFF